jgi:Flp pilus assembly protein TadG
LSKPYEQPNNRCVVHQMYTRGKCSVSKRRRGAAILEFSLAVLPFLALIFGVMDFAFPIFLRTLLTHAVREGSRYGITYQTRSGKTHSQSIQDVVMEQSLGFLAGTAGRDKVKVRFYSPTTFVEQTGSNRNISGNVVEVAIEGFSWQYMVPIWRSAAPIQIHATSSDRLETLPRNVPRPAP